MVAAVRAGKSERVVARTFHVSLWTVQRWVQRARGRRLDRVDWAARSHRPQRIVRTAPAVEERVLTLRRTLRRTSALGEYGAPAIHAALQAEGGHVPAVRTIGRILARGGALDGRQRVRRPAPPPGWYLPAVARRAAELDSFDVIEGLVIAGGTDVEVFTGIALHGGLPAAWPGPPVRAQMVLEALVTHWRAWGLPHYAQFDNDTRFQGAHQWQDALGRVIRLCLGLGVVPVFVPPREPGFQAAIEGFNGQWQAKVWRRFQHRSRPALRQRSERYLAALRGRRAERIAQAPPRRPFPTTWRLDLQAPPRGHLVFLRRADAQGVVQFLGRHWSTTPHWAHRLIRADVNFDAHLVHVYGLRRHTPRAQPLLRRTRYVFPHRGFRE